MEKQWGVYILRCADGTLYTGISNNVEKRIQKHNDGKGAKYLEPARKRPAKRVFWERTRTVAQRQNGKFKSRKCVVTTN